jgi:hypothetical protein
MNTDEVQEFAGNENSADAIALRRADEDAKVAGLIVDPLEAWRPVFDAVAWPPAIRRCIRVCASAPAR